MPSATSATRRRRARSPSWSPRDARVAARARVLAREAAEDRAGARLARFDVELKARAAGERVHLDLDLEGGLKVASS